MTRNMTFTWRLSFVVLAAGLAVAESGGNARAPLTPVICAGAQRSMKLNTDGTVWAWGSNGEFGLVDGTVEERPAPVPVGGLNGVVGISAGAVHVLAVKDDGTVWAWGSNFVGQLGDGTNVDRLAPAPVSGLNGMVAVAAGWNHSLALRNDGTVWAWGWNIARQVTNSSLFDWVYTPVQVPGVSGVVAVAGGYLTSFALRNDGTVWTWGGSNSAPVQVSGLNGVVAIASSYRHILALKGDGTVWAWGANESGELGDGTTTDRNSPVQVSGLRGVVAVSAGMEHSLAVKDDGTVWAWGANDYGKLGDGTTTYRSTPVQIGGLNGVVGVAAGTSHSLALKIDGSVLAWGQNTFGELGNGATGQRSTPLQVTGLQNVAKVSALGYHTLALMNDGTAWAWGYGVYGQLGNGKLTTHGTAVPVSGLSGVVAVAGGFTHSLAAENDGSVWAWGDSSGAALGDWVNAPRTAPLRIGLAGAKSVTAGTAYSMALKTDGTVWAWGRNQLGQLGDGTTADRGTPGQVIALSGVQAISGGTESALALKTDGTVWSWGGNGDGRLGDGTTINRSTPVQVSGLTAVTAVASGMGHGLALKTDGSVWAWGLNKYGQLGDGTLLARGTPAPVSGLSGVIAVAAGGNHSLALRNDGTVWAWGWNKYGQLGAGGTAQSATPVQVSGLSGVIAIGAGDSHSVAVKSNGTVWAWGSDTYGQLGNETVWFKSTPVQTLPSVPPGARTFSPDRWRLSFGAVPGAAPAVSPAQEIRLTQSGSGSAAWTAVTNQPWLQVSPASGTGSARLTVSILRSALPPVGASTGAVTILSPDAVNTPVSVPVSLQVAATTSVPFGSFDTPTNNVTGISGSIAVTGWALDDIGVTKVTIWRDPIGAEPVHPNGLIYIGDALFVPGTRPDVEARYPGFPNVDSAGWGYLMLTNTLPGKGNGTFKLHAFAVNGVGNQVELGAKTIGVANALSVKPFGALDSPAPGETISGSIANGGWALTPQPASLAIDGSTIWVNVDGVDVAHPSYGIGRGDVAAVLPGYANSNNAGGQFLLDSTAYANGMHTISWNVYDNLGRADGVGSRYFHIWNTTAPAQTLIGLLPDQGAPRRLLRLNGATRTRPETRTAGALSYRKGYDRNAPMSVRTPGAGGQYEPLEIEELERIEIELPGLPGGSSWTGAMRTGGDLRPLPIGSTLDEEDGVYYWQLGPGFLGEYQLEFSRPGMAPVVIRIRVAPKGSGPNLE